MNFFIYQLRDFNKVGRIHTKEQALGMQEPLLKMLDENHIKYDIIMGDSKDYDTITDVVCEAVEKNKQREKQAKKRDMER